MNCMASTPSLPSDNISWRIYVGTITTIVPATIVVILRYIARYVARAGLWWDDYTIAGALIFNWALAATRWVQIEKYGLGQDAAHLLPDRTLDLGKSFLATQILYFTNAVLTKASLLLLYYRIFGILRGFRWVLWASGCLVIGYYIACVIVSIAGCSPVSKFWDPSVPGKCINEIAFFRWNGVANMLLDFLVLCLPYPMAWRLQTTLRQKWILTGIFLLGGFVCVVSVLRVTSFDFSTLDNLTYVSVAPSIWSSVEQSVGVICACLPTLRPLFRRLCGSSAGNSCKRDSASTDLAQKGPSAGRSSQMDEESFLDSLGPSTSPASLSSRMNPEHMNGPLSQEIGTIGQNRGSWTLETGRSTTSQLFHDEDPERLMTRPESFA